MATTARISLAEYMQTSYRPDHENIDRGHRGAPFSEETRTGRYCVKDAWTAAEHLVVPGTAIYVDLEALFARLDRKPNGTAQP